MFAQRFKLTDLIILIGNYCHMPKITSKHSCGQHENRNDQKRFLRFFVDCLFFIKPRSFFLFFYQTFVCFYRQTCVLHANNKQKSLYHKLEINLNCRKYKTTYIPCIPIFDNIKFDICSHSSIWNERQNSKSTNEND